MPACDGAPPLPMMPAIAGEARAVTGPPAYQALECCGGHKRSRRYALQTSAALLRARAPVRLAPWRSSMTPPRRFRRRWMCVAAAARQANSKPSADARCAAGAVPEPRPQRAAESRLVRGSAAAASRPDRARVLSGAARGGPSQVASRVPTVAGGVAGAWRPRAALACCVAEPRARRLSEPPLPLRPRQVSDRFLHDAAAPLELQLFCAQTLRAKVEHDFEELPAGARVRGGAAMRRRTLRRA